MSKDNLSQVENYLRSLQQSIVQALEDIDGQGKFSLDPWQRETGGGGISAVLEEGALFEKAGVNFSHVLGDSLPGSASAHRQELTNVPFHAMGVSLVLHPRNPYVPTTHMNVRFFMAETQKERSVWWFGGGFDLTPYYPFDEDCIHWHTVSRNACLPFQEDFYMRFKKQCDDYFYLPHRNETRGIGGLFFDDFNELGFEKSFAFMQSVGDHFIKAYGPICEKRKNHPYGEREVNFQHYRRGRYVEFNLLYDRGTLFGLESGGRTESILMSLPPIVNFRYNWQPEAHTEEAKLYRDYLKPQNWLEKKVG